MTAFASLKKHSKAPGKKTIERASAKYLLVLDTNLAVKINFHSLDFGQCPFFGMIIGIAKREPRKIVLSKFNRSDCNF